MPEGGWVATAEPDPNWPDQARMIGHGIKQLLDIRDRKLELGYYLDATETDKTILKHVRRMAELDLLGAEREMIRGVDDDARPDGANDG